jgi:hypothetical protein
MEMEEAIRADVQDTAKLMAARFQRHAEDCLLQLILSGP